MLKTFISYKWEGEAHNRWVETFAADLRAAGIDAQLDKWEIRAGDSLTEYMTSRIDEASVILCIITDEYVVRDGPAPPGAAKGIGFVRRMSGMTVEAFQPRVALHVASQRRDRLSM